MFFIFWIKAVSPKLKKISDGTDPPQKKGHCVWGGVWSLRWKGFRLCLGPKNVHFLKMDHRNIFCEIVLLISCDIFWSTFTKLTYRRTYWTLTCQKTFNPFWKQVHGIVKPKISISKWTEGKWVNFKLIQVSLLGKKLYVKRVESLN